MALIMVVGYFFPLVLGGARLEALERGLSSPAAVLEREIERDQES
jgi:hypothetical protein